MKDLIKRHILCFLRDRWAVFFSFLSVFIILGLFLIFLNNFIENSVPSHLDTSDALLNYLIYGWVLSGVLVVSTVTAPLGFLGIMVRDLEKKTVSDFYTSPMPRNHIVLSYLIASVIVSTLLAGFNFLLGQIILLIRTGHMVPLLDSFYVLLLIVLLTAVFSALFYFVTSFIKTSNAHGTMSTLVGTLIGFVGGMYVPVGSFGTTLQTLLKSIPVLQGISAIRLVYMRDAMAQVFGNETVALRNYQEFFAVKLWIGDTALTLFALIVILSAWFILFTVLSLFRLKTFKQR